MRTREIGCREGNVRFVSPGREGLAIAPWLLAIAAGFLLSGCGATDAGGDPDAVTADLPGEPGGPDDVLPETPGEAVGEVGEDSTTADETPGAVTVPECCEVEDGRTVGNLLCQPGAYAGYTLFNPIFSRTTFLLDLCGRVVHSWPADCDMGSMVHLLDDGSILRGGLVEESPLFMGGGAGKVQKIAWDGTLLWDFEYRGENFIPHHDIAPLPNGNVLLIVWVRKSMEDAVAAGRDPDLVLEGDVLSESVVEIQPDGLNGGKVVWSWDIWDHLVQDFDRKKANYGDVGEHPERMDVNFPGHGMPAAGDLDWLHVNSIDYNAELDQIVLGALRSNEIFVIDHSTTTEEAAGHTGGRYGKGGDILYRWGKPQAYRAGNAKDQQLFHQHDAQWIAKGSPGAGNFLIFNNGETRPEQEYSTIDEIQPPGAGDGFYPEEKGKAWGPKDKSWKYEEANPTDFYSYFISGAQRLPNGNTLVCDGPRGTFFEVTADGQRVWEYVNPIWMGGTLNQGDALPAGLGGSKNHVFKIRKYAPEHPALAGRDLTPGPMIEGIRLP